MGDSAGLDGFSRRIPKAELHVHIEGTLEPELMFEIARRNGISTRHAAVEDLRAAYEFNDLQEFLDIYYEGAAVLQTEQDFYDMTLAYLRRAATDGVCRAEIFVDPQTHTDRGIAFGTMIEGAYAATVTGERELGVSGGLIMCFLRHLPAADAMNTLETSLPYRDKLIGVGLDSSEVGFPPELFADVFARAAAEGFHRVAHAGEEGPPEYIWSALDSLGAERIDHGIRSLDDPALVERLATDHIPLTVCPFSNIKLGGFATMAQHPLSDMLAAELNVSINSDDPAYFGGYIGDNYAATRQALELTREQLITIATNSIAATFLPLTEKRRLQTELNTFVNQSPL